MSRQPAGRLIRALEALRRLTFVALGRFRARLLSLRGASIGARSIIGPGCRIDRPWCLRLGTHVEIEDHVWVKITSDDARVELESHCFIGRGTELDISRELIVGAHTLISPGCFVTDHQHNFDGDGTIDTQGCAEAPVRIGSDVWIGTNSVILSGTSIGDRAIVGCSSLVRCDVSNRTVVAGAPIRTIRNRGKRA